jgi:hypothetical protein
MSTRVLGVESRLHEPQILPDSSRVGVPLTETFSGPFGGEGLSSLPAASESCSESP